MLPYEVKISKVGRRWRVRAWWVSPDRRLVSLEGDYPSFAAALKACGDADPS